MVNSNRIQVGCINSANNGLNCVAGRMNSIVGGEFELNCPIETLT